MTERMDVDQFRRQMGTMPAKKQGTPAVKTSARKPGKFRGKTNGRYGGKRHVPGQMNKTEQEYADVLEQRRAKGEVERWEFESVTFKLAADCRYTPDFLVELASGEIEFIDTKGTGPIDPVSKVKIRTAAEKFWKFTFAMEQKRTKKAGGGWERTEF